MEISKLSYQDAIIELEKNHLYPNPIIEAGTTDIIGLMVRTSPNYKDDRLLIMKGMLPKEFKLRWDKSQAAIIIEKK